MVAVGFVFSLPARRLLAFHFFFFTMVVLSGVVGKSRAGATIHLKCLASAPWKSRQKLDRRACRGSGVGGGGCPDMLLHSCVDNFWRAWGVSGSDPGRSHTMCC